MIPEREGWARAVVLTASVAVLVTSALSSFRLGFADSLATSWVVNGPRVLLGAATGALLALSGWLRLDSGENRPLVELEIYAWATGAAGGAYLLAGGTGGALGWLLVVVGSVAGGALAWALVRALDRPRRWTNPAAAVLLVGLIGIAALAGTYSRERRGPASAAATWLLGDLGFATFESAMVALALAAALVLVTLRALDHDEVGRRRTLALLALSLGFGVAGPLAFVGTFAPRTVRAIVGVAPTRARLVTTVVAGAATVVAVDAVPRFLVGGYAFSWNVSAGLLAIPIFLGWNRMRLRRETGAAPLVFEMGELVLLAGLTIAACVVVGGFVGTIRALT